MADKHHQPQQIGRDISMWNVSALSMVTKSLILGERAGHGTWLLHTLVMSMQVGNLTSLCLSLLTCKVESGGRIAHASQVAVSS